MIAGGLEQDADHRGRARRVRCALGEGAVLLDRGGGFSLFHVVAGEQLVRVEAAGLRAQDVEQPLLGRGIVPFHQIDARREHLRRGVIRIGRQPLRDA